MNNKSILMPHKCQTAGWCLLLSAMLTWVAKVIVTYLAFDIDVTWYMAKTIHFLLLLSLFFIAFSKEKVEDEMISALRLKAVGITGYVFFIVFILLSMILELRLYTLVPMFNRDGFDMLKLYLSEFFLIMLPVLIGTLYYTIFRVILGRSRKEGNI